MTERDEPIRSRQNSLLKRVRAVASGKRDGVVLLEGERLIRDAFACGIEFECLLFEPRVADQG